MPVLDQYHPCSQSDYWQHSPQPRQSPLLRHSRRSFSLQLPANTPSPQPPVRRLASRRTSIATPRPTHNIFPDTPDSTKLQPPHFLLRDLDQYPRGYTPLLPSQWDLPPQVPPKPPLQARRNRLSFASREESLHSCNSTRPSHTANASLSDDLDFPSDHARYSNSSSTMSPVAPSRPSLLALHTDRPLPETPMHSNKRPKSPGNPLTSFFNWRRGPADNHAQSPTASIFGSSPLTSPTAARTPSDTRTHLLAPNSQIRQATDKSARNSIESFSALPLLAPEVMKHVDSLLAELRAVGAELAASIGREMELEDELDLCKVDLQPYSNNEAGKRTSDYYSDSGASSVRLPAADAELKLQGLEKMRRKAEQEKAQMRIDMAQKVQEDLNERKALQMHIQALEEELHNQASAHADALDRERELEASIVEHKTNLEEEQGSRQESVHLLNTTRREAETCANERDNLRDEVVPQLQDRIEGLESEVTELQNLAYENTRLQQDVHWLRNENQTLVNARRLQLEMQQQHARYRPGSSFAEPLTPDSSPDHPPRSSSLQRGKSTKHAANTSPKLGGTVETNDAEASTDTIKEVEAQRDVLHQTLRNLILRRDIEARQYAKQVRLLQVERDRALSGKPRRAGYSSRVRHARQEIDELRRRADEAMTQKWQCEKGLGGLKMDLDRAKEETASLRVLLRESPGAEVVLMASPSSVYDGTDDESAYATTLCTEGTLSGLGINTQCGAGGRRSWTIEDDGSLQKLQVRLLAAIERGERGQAACAQQLSMLETDLCNAESALLAAQSVSESLLGSQEERVRAVGASREQHARRLIRSQLASSPLMAASASQSKACSPMLEASATMLTPLFANKRARFELATGQPGARDDVKILESRVRELEDATRRVEWEMQGAVAKMMEEQREVVALREQTAGWM